MLYLHIVTFLIIAPYKCLIYLLTYRTSQSTSASDVVFCLFHLNALTNILVLEHTSKCVQQKMCYKYSNTKKEHEHVHITIIFITWLYR